MPRPRCLTCDNVGQVIEFRLTWLRKGLEGEPPAKCSRRVESQQAGVERMQELAENEYDPQILSGARACPNCRAGRESAAAVKTAAAKPAAPAEREVKQEWPPDRDWKMAAAGDHED